MNDRQQLNRVKIEEAFRIIGQYLLDRKTLGEIAIYGGSAILFQFDWRKTSMDVDARVTSERNHGIIIDAVNEAAKQLRLPRHGSMKVSRCMHGAKKTMQTESWWASILRRSDLG
jgi:hypothetical protein